MNFHITNLHNVAGAAAMAQDGVVQAAKPLGFKELGIFRQKFYEDYWNSISHQIDGVIAPLYYGDVVIFQYPGWNGPDYDEEGYTGNNGQRKVKIERKRKNMEKEMEMNKNVEEKINRHRGKRITLTILGYLCVIVVLLAVLPAVLPPIFGYHTYTLGNDTTGNISKYGSVVYLKEVDEGSWQNGNLVAVKSAETGRDVDVYYVDSNDTAGETLAFDTGDMAKYDKIAGKVIAQTPFIGYLSQLCFSVVGIILIVILFVAGLGLMMYTNKISKEINQMGEDQKELSGENS